MVNCISAGINRALHYCAPVGFSDFAMGKNLLLFFVSMETRLKVHVLEILKEETMQVVAFTFFNFFF